MCVFVFFVLAECHSPQCQEDLTTAPLGVPAVAILPLHTSSPERRITQKEIIAGEERPRYVLQAQYKSSPGMYNPFAPNKAASQPADSGSTPCAIHTDSICFVFIQFAPFCCFFCRSIVCVCASLFLSHHHHHTTKDVEYFF